MKKICTILFLLVFATTKLIAQVPYKMSYQTVVRNSANQLVNNQQVGIKISLLQGSATGNAVFTQTFAPITNANGLATIVIGDTSAAYNSISWASGGPFFIKTEIDPTGGTNYSIEATSELMSVPYAMVAGYVASQGKSTFVLSGDITDAEAATRIIKEVGPNTEHIRIEYTNNLTTLDLSTIKTPLHTIDIEVINNEKLTSINFGPLESNEDYLRINYNKVLKNIIFPEFKTSEGDVLIGNYGFSALSNLQLPKLTHILYQLSIQTDSSVTTLDLPMLKYIGKKENASGVSIFQLNIPNLQQINAPALELIYANFDLSNVKYLPTINFPSLKEIKNLTLTNDSSLLSINLPALTTCGQLNINNDSLLTNIQIANLTTLNDSYSNIGGNPLITSINLPLLTTIKYNFGIANNKNLVSVLLPVLSYVGKLSISYDSAITSLSFPALTTAYFITIEDNPVLNSVAIPNLVESGGMNINYNSNLSTFVFPPLTTNIASGSNWANFYLFRNAFTSATVNDVLHRMVLCPVFTNTTQLILNYQTPPAPPTGQGITDKAILVGKGMYVTTD